MKRIFKIISVFAIAIIAAYLLKNQIGKSTTRLESLFLPCRSPIAYSLGSYDERFNISKSDFLKIATEAEQIWEKPIGKQLFTYDPSGALKINLIYDYREEATLKLKSLGLNIETSNKNYDGLKSRYEALKAEYDSEKITFDSQVSAFQNLRNDYEKEVAYWNSRGGAPKDVYEKLNQERIDLNNRISSINAAQTKINADVDEINALVVILNKLRLALNLTIDQFNEIGKSRGEQFSEGDYENGPSGNSINVYQFSNREELLRLLAHEMGHAIGLEHLNSPQSIMYYLNQSTNNKLTTEDLSALKNRCGIK